MCQKMNALSRNYIVRQSFEIYINTQLDALIIIYS